MIISFRYTAKELLANRTRLYLTLLALACGTAAIAFMLSLGQGLREQYLKKSDLGKLNLPVSSGTTTMAYQGTPIGTRIRLTPADVQILKNAIPEIQTILESYSVSQSITYRNNSVGSPIGAVGSGIPSVLAVSPRFDKIKRITIQPGGRFFNDVDNMLKSPTIVLGDQVAAQLFKGYYENPVGKIVLLGGKSFTVIGLTEPSQIGSNVSHSLSLDAWIPVATYQSLMPNAENLRLIVVPKSINQIDDIKNRIQAVMARTHQFDPKDTGAIYIQDNNQWNKQRLLLLLGLQLLLGTIGGITLAMASVSVANVMFTAIDSATREIGIKIAIGAQRYHILSYYLFEGFLVTAIGGFIGISASLLLAWGYNHLFALAGLSHSSLSTLGNVQAKPSFTVLLTVILILGIVGFLAGFFPARKAASIDPVEALKHE